MEENQDNVSTKKESILHVIKFTLFSISAGGIQFLAFTLCSQVIKLPTWLAYMIALVLSILWNFTLNRKFTFKSAANVPIAMVKISLYYAVFLPLSTLWVHALTGVGINEYVILAGTMLTNFVTEFLFTKFVVYRNQINTALETGDSV